MKLPDFCSTPAKGLPFGAKAGFTMVEFMVATAILLVVTGGALTFMNMAGVSISGITAQNDANTKAGHMLEFLQNRVRLATSISNSSSGNILTLGFDDDPTNDSNHDHTDYNDKDHFERFQFIGVNSTNASACSSNKLVYTPNVASVSNRVLVAKGVRNLPRCNIFTVTNFQTTVILRFGIVDTFARNYYQGVELQGTAVTLNRPPTTNVISLLP